MRTPTALLAAKRVRIARHHYPVYAAYLDQVRYWPYHQPNTQAAFAHYLRRRLSR